MSQPTYPVTPQPTLAVTPYTQTTLALPCTTRALQNLADYNTPGLLEQNPLLQYKEGEIIINKLSTKNKIFTFPQPVTFFVQPKLHDEGERDIPRHYNTDIVC